MKQAYFAGGCFWCAAAAFEGLDGVLSTESGYAGGEEQNPTYEQVKAQLTHHRETVRVVYDERALSFNDLLAAFFAFVDPFDAGGQFIDRGASYTLAVYYTDETERRAAQAAVAALCAETGRAAAVSVEPLKTFFPAEEYHQDFGRKHPDLLAAELRASGRKKES